MKRYFIEVAYKGTNYSGFQIQKNATTIQQEIENALATIYRTPFQLTGSSRTDAGVHALQNFFHFDSDKLSPETVYKLNAILSRDIAVKQILPVHNSAHSRFDAVSREYQYKIHTYKNPFQNQLSLYFPYKLDLGVIQEATIYINEQVDFTAFSKVNTQVKNFNCSIIACEWIQHHQEYLFYIKANRFLRGMVRLLTGSLLKLGRGKMSFKDFQNQFVYPQKGGIAAPAHGLYLKQVNFPVDYFGLSH